MIMTYIMIAISCVCRTQGEDEVLDQTAPDGTLADHDNSSEPAGNDLDAPYRKPDCFFEAPCDLIAVLSHPSLGMCQLVSQ